MAKAIINGQEIFGNVHMGEGGDVANSNIADVYDPTQTYNAGDRRIYNDVLYVCNDDNVTGAWDSTKWDSATIDEIISALTAADIPYSSGVSVADKLDSLNNTVITPTYATQTNFTFPYNNNRIVRSGNVVMVYLGVRCDTPYVASPGIKVISGLPKPDVTTNVFFTASSWNNNDSKVRVMIDTDGALFLRVGVASHDYDVLFSYITKD